jgi:hypothetical protein
MAATAAMRAPAAGPGSASARLASSSVVASLRRASHTRPAAHSSSSAAGHGRAWAIAALLAARPAAGTVGFPCT